MLSGCAQTDTVSFVTPSFSMRYAFRLHSTVQDPISKPGRYEEHTVKVRAFSNWYGFIGRIIGETASFENGSVSSLARNWHIYFFWRGGGGSVFENNRYNEQKCYHGF